MDLLYAHSSSSCYSQRVVLFHQHQHVMATESGTIKAIKLLLLLLWSLVPDSRIRSRIRQPPGILASNRPHCYTADTPRPPARQRGVMQCFWCVKHSLITVLMNDTSSASPSLGRAVLTCEGRNPAILDGCRTKLA